MKKFGCLISMLFIFSLAIVDSYYFTYNNKKLNNTDTNYYGVYQFEIDNAINKLIYCEESSYPIGVLIVDVEILKVLPYDSMSNPYFLCIKTEASVIPGSVARYSFPQYTFDQNYVNSCLSINSFLQSKNGSSFTKKGSSQQSNGNIISNSSSYSAGLEYGIKGTFSIDFIIEAEIEGSAGGYHTWEIANTYTTNDPVLSHSLLSNGYNFTYIFADLDPTSTLIPANHIAFTTQLDTFFEVKQVYPTVKDSIHAYINFDVTYELRNKNTNEIFSENELYCFSTQY